MDSKHCRCICPEIAAMTPQPKPNSLPNVAPHLPRFGTCCQGQLRRHHQPRRFSFRRRLLRVVPFAQEIASADMYVVFLLDRRGAVARF